MNIALLIAGGSGNRMGQDIPKQFMHVDGVPIIIRTMQCFQQHPDVSAIAVVCLNGWETVLQSYANQFMIDKLKWIFPGGNTGMESIHNGVYGLKEMGCNDEDLVLIHDGVRPLLSQEIISQISQFAKLMAMLLQVFNAEKLYWKAEMDLLLQQVFRVILLFALRLRKLFD